MNEIDTNRDVHPPVEERYLDQSLSLSDLGRALKRSWLLMVGAILVCELLAVLYLAATPARYTTDMMLAPQQNSDSQALQPSGLSALSGVSGLLGTGGANGTSNFEKFRALFTSIQTAQLIDKKFELLQKRFPGWNSQIQSWHIPGLTVSNAAQRFARFLLGRPIWRAPEAADLSAMLSSQFTLTKGSDNGFLVASTISDDPQFSKILLQALTDATNEILRQKAQQQASVQIAYLSKELETVSNAAHRQVLSTLLLQQEQNMMLSQSNLPYAAEVLSPPTTHYDQPHPGVSLTLAGGMLAGLAIGLLIAFVREARGRERGVVPASSEEILYKWRRSTTKHRSAANRSDKRT